MKFQGDIFSIPTDNFKNHYMLVFDLTSMQDATEKFHYPKLVGELLKLELNSIFPLERVTELSVLGKCMSSVAVDKFSVVGKIIRSGKGFFSATDQPDATTQVSVQRFISF